MKILPGSRKVAKSERESAWQEMARQVAHEIKNPLTPMRLTIQSFQQNFNHKDPENIKKINNLSNTLIQQIDTMSQVATAFSDFASLPKAKIGDHLTLADIAASAFYELRQCLILESRRLRINTNQAVGAHSLTLMMINSTPYSIFGITILLPLAKC